MLQFIKVQMVCCALEGQYAWLLSALEGRTHTRILPYDHVLHSAQLCLPGWARGSNLITVQGSLVRAVRRVEEVLRQATAGAQVMGELQLVELFEESQRRIKRDIVFAASLYL